ncbi:MAG: hypothetical protein ACSHWU_08555 [Marinicella sp.]
MKSLVLITILFSFNVFSHETEEARSSHYTKYLCYHNGKEFSVGSTLCMQRQNTEKHYVAQCEIGAINNIGDIAIWKIDPAEKNLCKIVPNNL